MSFIYSSVHVFPTFSPVFIVNDRYRRDPPLRHATSVAFIKRGFNSFLALKVHVPALQAKWERDEEKKIVKRK